MFRNFEKTARLVDVAERVFGIEVRGKGKTKEARLEARVARVLDAAYWRRLSRVISRVLTAPAEGKL